MSTAALSTWRCFAWIALAASSAWMAKQWQLGGSPASQSSPIENLLTRAELSFAQLLETRTDSYEETVKAYKLRRRRDPPRGFQSWYDQACNHDAIMIESFWDPVYDDLMEYAELAPSRLKVLAELAAKSPSQLVNGHYVRNGQVSSDCQADNLECHQAGQMIAKVAKWLPDMTIPINGNVSPRILIPHDRPPTLQLNTSDDIFFTQDESWEQTWSNVCPPDSPTRQWLSSGQDLPAPQPQNSLISDLHRWRDICQQYWMAKRHGALVRPLATQIATDRMPIFAYARLASIETAIRYPDTISWTQDSEYFSQTASENPSSFRSKEVKAFWRGSNTGGGPEPHNWPHFHRHRFVALNNASYLHGVRSGDLVDWADVPSPVTARIMQLAEDHVDVGFTFITCPPKHHPCHFLSSHFLQLPQLPLAKMLSRYRFLFDVDGNSYSGRFYGLLLSNSVVLKATLFEEWHDARLMPWLHYIPISNHFGDDVWDVLEFLLANEDRAEQIAHAARSWALKVLRPVDMELYVLRLLLEWGRLLEADE